MKHLVVAFSTEMLKARRSHVPLMTALGFALAPLMGGFFMVVLKDPERARRLGLIGAKARFLAGAADWPTFFGILSQAVAVGGILLFSLVASWVFGREHSDRTAKDLLALPTKRSTIVAAKFALFAFWAGGLALFVLCLGLVVGWLVDLPGWSGELFVSASWHLLVTVGMTIFVVTPIAYAASVGRGYLAPMGVAILLLFLAQVFAAAGWGEYFPWSVPGMYSGVAGAEVASVGIASYLVVVATGLFGVMATLLWWGIADQNR